MFDLNAFIMSAINGMIGNYPDWQVREYALGWYTKGKLTEADLAAVDAAITAHNAPPEPIAPEETTPEPTPEPAPETPAE